MKAAVVSANGLVALPPAHLGLGDYFALAPYAVRHPLAVGVPAHVVAHFGRVDLLSVDQPALQAARAECPDSLLSLGKAVLVLTEGVYEAQDALVRLYLVDPLYTPYRAPSTPPDPLVVH